MSSLLNIYLKKIKNEGILIIENQSDYNNLINETNPDAHYIIALHHYKKEEHDLAYKHLMKSINGGSKLGYNTVGYHYDVVEKNSDKAIIWYQKAIDTNKSSNAMRNMALYYLNKKDNINIAKYLDMATKYCDNKFTMYDIASTYNDINNEQKYLS